MYACMSLCVFYLKNKLHLQVNIFVLHLDIHCELSAKHHSKNIRLKTTEATPPCQKMQYDNNNVMGKDIEV